ncbi:MAG: T9SS type A sorting domain-containing protein [Saprospiraceae bacterium]|nr:T9SS type A sorting domain-containing protein [Candidatus Opimibacter skivensis]
MMHLRLPLLATIGLLAFSITMPVTAQTKMEWQKTIGTPFHDNALQVFPDEQGNIIVIGKESHADFAGNIREYMMVVKFDAAGQEIWKTYHDVAFNVFNAPVDYSIGDHFYTEEFGDTLLNLIIKIQDRALQYKILDHSGQYYFYEETLAEIIDVNRENEKVYAKVLCSFQQSCYGPDSLVVQRFDPSPDSLIFDPVVWTFEMKQDFRTAPFQGHYDFNIQAIREDGQGNTYLLVQIEKWQFQFCTDCADAFIDAWCEVFKFDAEGNFIGHINLKTAKAVVSGMSFVELNDESITIQINDINAAGTKLLTTICRLNHDLTIQKKFEMTEAYNLVRADVDGNLVTCRNIFDDTDPEIHGLSDVLVSKFDADGNFIEQAYFGGSSWDFPRALTVTEDGAIYFLANSESNDFDVTENFGGQDMWLVKLTEDGATSVEDQVVAGPLSVFPNPVGDMVHLMTDEPLHIAVYDMHGRQVYQSAKGQFIKQIDVSSFPQGCYLLKGVNEGQQVYTTRVIKL